ncbi:MAG: LPS assembly protein LptD [Rhizomicrobium sp.]
MAGAGRLHASHLIVAALLAVACVLPAAAAQPSVLKGGLLGPKGSAGLLRADSVDYDTNTSVVTATGHVEIDYNGRILTADKVTYDQDKDIATADGHVTIMAPNGDVIFGTHAVLTDAMKDGTVDAFAALIGQYGRLASVRANRIDDGAHTIMARAIYTACKICKERGDRTPLWAVKATRAYYDQVNHRIYYYDATIQLYGVPVMYTPYFSQPDPTVKHSSGILIPTFGTSSTLGTFFKVPLYIAFSDSQDMTLMPYYATHGGEMLEGEYRQRWDHGGMWLQATVTDTPYGGIDGTQNQVYSSLFGSGIIPINDTWHAGYDVQLTSNETYLDLYDLSQYDRLNNDLFLEGISGRSHFEITGYFFQGLRAADVNSEFPVVLPLVDYTYIPLDDVLGGTFRFDFNTAAISRQIGQDDQRATAELDWKLPLITADGQLITFVADARGDIYHVSDAPITLSSQSDYYVSRGLPYAAVDWRWPFASGPVFGASSLVLTPIAQLIYAPYGDNPSNIPNEDSTDFQLDDTDIFSFDRLPGFDLVETGPRANLGILGNLIYPSGSVDFLAGQIFRLRPDPIFAADSGLSGRRSDVVGRVTVNFLPNWSVTERVDVDSSTGSLERNEVYVNAIYGRTTLQLSYLKLPEEEVLLGLGSREEINGQATIGLWDNWIAYAGAERDIAGNEMLASEFGLGYEDECLGISLTYDRTYTSDRNVPPSTAMVFRIELKTSDTSNQQSDLFPRHLYSQIEL